MSEFRVNSITNQDGSAGPQVCGVSTFSGKSGVQIPSGSSEFRRQDGGGRGRGIFFANYPAPSTDAIEKVEIATTGNATDFGDTSEPRNLGASFASSTRGILAGGQPGASPYYVSTIDFVIISSEGGANDFGGGCLGSPTRAVFCTGNHTHADYIQIMSTGNAVDFGDIQDRQGGGAGGCSNGHGGLG